MDQALNRLKRLAVEFAPALALAYFIMLGGTQYGEYVGWLRVINSLIAAIVIAVYATTGAGRFDRTDRLVLFALLIFLGASVVSAHPRQSLDAALGALAWVAVFFVGRDLLGDERSRGPLLGTMRMLAVVVTLFLASSELSTITRWMSLSDASMVPPIGLPVDGRPWGHEYDLGTLALMLYPSWLIGRKSSLTVVIAASLGLVLGLAILALGGRAIWLAVIASSLFVAAPHARQVVRVAHGAYRYVVSGAIAVAAVVFAVIALPFLDRLLTGPTITQRLAMWSASVEGWIDRPIAGHGPGTYQWILQTTDYFNANSGHHRHPHNALFQLLPEVGVLGVAAVVILVVAVVWPLIQRKRYLSLWPIGVFLVGGVGSNPTVYPFLISSAIFWAAFGLPRTERKGQIPMSAQSRPTAARAPGRSRLRLGVVAALGTIAIAVTPLLAAGVLYDRAVFAAADGDVLSARRDLDAAATLDPAMVIYVRQRGVASLILGDTGDAVRDLRRAATLNPLDVVTWRALAISLAALDEREAARDAIRRGLEADRSDATTHLLQALWQSGDGDVAALRQTVGEVALAWPTVVFAPGWTDLLAGVLDTNQVVELALDRWQDGARSPEPIRGQPLLLSILGGRSDLFSEALTTADQSELLAAATVAVLWCEEDADEALAALPDSERRTELYWAVRLQNAGEHGSTDPVALEAYDLLTRFRPSHERALEHLNPLRQNLTSGAVDPWGYGRLPIGWPDAPIELPHPKAGESLWLIDPPAARASAGIENGPGRCTAP